MLTHGDANFADYELKSRNGVQRKGPNWRYGELGLSTDARVKLLAAFRNYVPRAFHGPVTNSLYARERDFMFRYPSQLWNELLPQRQVHMVFEKHGDVGTATAAAHMQSIFNAALAEPVTQEATVQTAKNAPRAAPVMALEGSTVMFRASDDAA